jgi:hypothetical protein
MFGKYNGFVSKARVSACMYFLVSDKTRQRVFRNSLKYDYKRILIRMNNYIIILIRMNNYIKNTNEDEFYQI